MCNKNYGVNSATFLLHVSYAATRIINYFKTLFQSSYVSKSPFSHLQTLCNTSESVFIRMNALFEIAEAPKRPRLNNRRSATLLLDTITVVTVVLFIGGQEDTYMYRSEGVTDACRLWCIPLRHRKQSVRRNK